MSLLHIERLGHHGDGIAEDGSHHPLTLPGDSVDPDSGQHHIGSSEIRATPICPHFGTCGGCSLQHAAEGWLSAWKQGVVKRALAARSLDAPLRDIHVSPPGSRKRAVFSGRRTKKAAQIGFHGRRSDAVVPVTTCPVVLPGMLHLRPALEDLVRIGASRKSEVKLSVTESEAGWDVDVRGGKPMATLDFSMLATLAECHDLARLSWEGEPVVVRRPPVQSFGAARVVPPPGAFLQATLDAERFMVGRVCAAVGDARRVADLFCGCGTFTLPLAARSEVLAVETDAACLSALDDGWRQAAGLKRVVTATRDLFRRPVLPIEFKELEAVVFDPPRAGADAQAHALARSDVPVAVAVSCNPVSFARDAEILVGGGFSLDWIDVIDQFRWSPHVELVARFSR